MDTATATDSRLVRGLNGPLQRTRRDYAAGHDRPPGRYLAAIRSFAAFTAAWTTVVRRAGRPVPERPPSRGTWS